MKQQTATQNDLFAMTEALARANGILVAQALKLVAPDQLDTFTMSLPGLALRVGQSADVVGRFLEHAEVGVRAFVRNES